MDYIVISETDNQKYKKNNWNAAFGLQAVDGLTPSEYMVSQAKDNVLGKISYSEVKNNVNSYYSSQQIKNADEEEADKVSIRIVEILNDNSFVFSPLTLLQYHKILFSGLDLGISHKYIGAFRDYNISKKEPILNGASVNYADWRMIKDTLDYDFSEEKAQKYTQMNGIERIQRIATFTSRIWQVHPFGEGNTRTTAVFIQKYLNSMGFNVNNELLKDNSLYFRNALVRANYSNIPLGIEERYEYLYNFFSALLYGTEKHFNNSDLHI